jgi:hypothetical protein
VKARKDEEKRQRMEELERMKALKKDQVMKKLEIIRKNAGAEGQQPLIFMFYATFRN